MLDVGAVVGLEDRLYGHHCDEEGDTARQAGAVLEPAEPGGSRDGHAEQKPHRSGHECEDGVDHGRIEK